MEQVDLFSVLDRSGCRHHGKANVCDACPEEYETDARGFVHPSLCKGRIPLRHCRVCNRLVTREEWSYEPKDWRNLHNCKHWSCCVDCYGALPPVPQREPLNGPAKKRRGKAK